jgi:hypothetical protein
MVCLPRGFVVDASRSQYVSRSHLSLQCLLRVHHKFEKWRSIYVQPSMCGGQQRGGLRWLISKLSFREEEISEGQQTVEI